MTRLGRVWLLTTWLTVLSLLPLPWEQLGRWRPPVDLGAVAHAASTLPFGLPIPGSPSVRPQIPTANPPEDVVLQQPGGLALGTVARITPHFEIDDPPGHGPGVEARLQLAGEPLVVAAVRLQGVASGRRARRDGRATVFDIPADGVVPSGPVQPRLLLPLDQGHSARSGQDQIASPVATATPTATPRAPTATPTPGASGTPGPAVQPAAAPTSTPTPDTRPPTPAGNRLGARLEVRYEPSPDGTSVKERLLLHDRPRTNVLEYRLATDGLEVTAEPDGSLALRDHASRPLFAIPAPTFTDARGRSGTASYRLGPGRGQARHFELVLDPQLLATGALPLEVDPGLQLIPTTGSDLLSGAAAPFQRQSVASRDGTQFFAYYDSGGAGALKFITSVNNFTSTVAGPTTIASDVGQGGFAVEIDPASDRVFVGVAGATSSGSTNVLRIYPLTYVPATKTWTVDAPIEVQPPNTSNPVWSAATLAIEQGASSYLWIGAEERGSNGRYTSRAWYAPLTNGSLGSTWTNADPSFATQTN